MSIIYRPKGRAGEYSHLAINHYIGCGHGCEYCYCPKVLHISKEEFHTRPRAREGIIEQLKKEIKSTRAQEHKSKGERVLLSFACDPYQPLDTELGLTREIICILVDNHIPFQVLTKGGFRAARDFDLYGDNDMFAATLTFTKDGQSLKTEPNAATPFERIETLKLAHKQGIKTWVSLEPVIDPIQSLELIQKTAEFVSHYKIGVLNYFPGGINGVSHPVDWRRFAIAAIMLCKAYHKTYYIKQDLAKYLEGISYENTDIRLVRRSLGEGGKMTDYRPQTKGQGSFKF
jgi:DNA repair photolyase